MCKFCSKDTEFLYTENKCNNNNNKIISHELTTKIGFCEDHIRIFCTSTDRDIHLKSHASMYGDWEDFDDDKSIDDFLKNDHKIEINFCPFCGRKLREKDITPKELMIIRGRKIKN